jgi:hypothetical protein
MAAVYPGAVRVYQPHSNLTEYVDAAHVNALQEEVIAIEQTLGVAPAQYQGTSYGTVNGRLNAIQAQIAALQTQIAAVATANQQGWNTPFCSVNNNQFTVGATAWAGGVISFPQSPYDSSGMWSPNTSQFVCRRTGVWLVTAQITFQSFGISPGGWFVFNSWLRDSNGAPVTGGGAGDLITEPENVSVFTMSAVWAGVVSIGQVFTFQTGYYNNNGYAGVIYGSCEAQMAFLRPTS